MKTAIRESRFGFFVNAVTVARTAPVWLLHGVAFVTSDLVAGRPLNACTRLKRVKGDQQLDHQEQLNVTFWPSPLVDHHSMSSSQRFR